MSWKIPKAESNGFATELSKQLNIHPITAQILLNRGIKTKEEAGQFLMPKLGDLPDPFLLPDMERAASRIVTAIKNNEKIAIFGDYDTDGVTSTALLVRFFKECGVDVDCYIPNRLSEGYGLSLKGVDTIHSKKASLIITADNGTNCHEEINYANSLGIDVVVTDHHEITEDLPGALAVVNPKRIDKDNPFGELAGVGVAFYLAAALRIKLRKEGFFKTDEPDLRMYLDLVALGTVADVAPLVGVNRTMVKHGLEVLKRTNNIGIKSLACAAATELEKTNTYTIAFRLAPRINAAGRLGNQDLGLKLLLTNDKYLAFELADKLSKMNSERQAIEKEIIKQMSEIIDNSDKTRSSIVLWSDKWHPGVIGIAASRLAELHKKPCALISLENGMGRGSVRSVGNYDIMNNLNGCAGILKNFGGHTAAAGFDIKAENLDRFYEQFEDHASKNLTIEDRTPNIPIDSEIDISEITAELINEIELLEPFGEGNPQPIFATGACTAEDCRIVGSNHLKFRIKNDTTVVDAIGFGLGDKKIETTGKYRFAGVPQQNEWNGKISIQFKVKDIELA